MSDPTIYEGLAARFPASAHKTKSMGGRDLTYVDGEMVVSKLNDVLGFDGWAFEVKDVKILDDEVWALGRLTVYSGYRTIVREQAGGQIINRTRAIPARAFVPADDDRPEQPAVPAQKGQIIELNNDIKGAITDCLKKCATLVGVGLYLYDPVERREVEAEMKQARSPKPAAAAPKATGTPVAATTPPASGVQPTSSSTTATSARSEPTPLKTKDELAADLERGIAYAKSIGLDPADMDTSKWARADYEEVIAALRQQCREMLASKTQPAAV